MYAALSHLKPCQNVEMICLELLTPPAMSFAERLLYIHCRLASVEKFCTIHAAKFPINKKNLFVSKSYQITCP